MFGARPCVCPCVCVCVYVCGTLCDSLAFVALRCAEAPFCEREVKERESVFLPVSLTLALSRCLPVATRSLPVRLSRVDG